MVAAAKRSGCYLATGFNYRFYPSILKAREILESDLVGELDHIRSYAGYSASDLGQDWLHDVDVMGGGALRDNGIHLIDHCLPDRGWCANIVNEHKNGVVAVGGSVDKKDSDTTLNWAIYLSDFSRYMSPVNEGAYSGQTCQ